MTSFIPKWFLSALACVSLSAASTTIEKCFTVIAVDLSRDELALYLNDDKGRPFKRFDRLAAWLKPRGKTLRFAINAGMYHRDFSPVGLLAIDGKQISPLNRDDGAGNFFMKPNGVFYVAASGANVVETSSYRLSAKDVRFATQSGPMLVNKGTIHPAFNANSR